MVDKSSPKYRGTISAASGLGGTVGMLSGAGIATLFTTMVDYQTIGQYLLFIAPGIFGAILIAIFIIFLKDTPIQKPQGKMRF
jgi:MFS family permease